MGGWRWRAGRGGRPRRRRSFALPAPRLPAEPVHGARDHSRKKNGETGAQGSSRPRRRSPNVGGGVGGQGEAESPGSVLPAPRLPAEPVHGARATVAEKRTATQARKVLSRPRRTLAECWGVTFEGRAKREAPAQAELRPPMVCVEPTKSVLGLFHLFRATKLPFLRIKVQADESL